jgi:hypothetical protein
VKLVVNNCYGRFGLSPKAQERYWGLKGKNLAEVPREEFARSETIERHDPVLVRVVEEMGKAADGTCARLTVIEIPDGVDYVIRDYDGMEWVAWG